MPVFLCLSSFIYVMSAAGIGIEQPFCARLSAGKAYTTKAAIELTQQVAGFCTAAKAMQWGTWRRARASLLQTWPVVLVC